MVLLGENNPNCNDIDRNQTVPSWLESFRSARRGACFREKDQAINYAGCPAQAKVWSRPRTNVRSSSRFVEKNSVDEYVFTVSVARIVLQVRSIRPRRCPMFGFEIAVHEN